MTAGHLGGVFLLLATGCAGPLASLHGVARTDVNGTAVTVRHAAEPAEVALLLDGLARATPAVRRWGGLPQPVTLYVVPHHPAFERALGRREPTLHAWARYDDILLESPSAWGADAARLGTLLAHELAHCVTFQRIGTAQDWNRRGLPFWFREGLATVTANQAAELPTLEELAGWLRLQPDDVYARAEQLVATDYRGAYGLAHHSVVFLLKRYGDGAVPQLFAGLAQGATFDDAFRAATGVDRAAFENDARNYFRLRAFRGWGLPMKPIPSPRAK